MARVLRECSHVKPVTTKPVTTKPVTPMTQRVSRTSEVESNRRATKLRYLQVLKRTGIMGSMRKAARRRLRILCYHGIWLGSQQFAGNSMFMCAADFSRRMRLLEDWGYRVLPLEQAAGLMQSNALSDDTVAITIDDGWFGTFHLMLPILKAHGYAATLYCDTANLEWGKAVPHVMAAYVRLIHCKGSPLPPVAETLYRCALDLSSSPKERLAAAIAFAGAAKMDLQSYFDKRAFAYMTPCELRAVRAAGISVQLHTHTHSMRDFSREAVSEEIALNRSVLARELKDQEGAFRHFCYPSGLATRTVTATLRNLGIETATTLRPGLCRATGQDPLLLPRIIDGSHQTDLEFEADLAGAGSWHRQAAALLGG